MTQEEAEKEFEDIAYRMSDEMLHEDGEISMHQARIKFDALRRRAKVILKLGFVPTGQAMLSDAYHEGWLS
tara:strand:+ start:276 stop:488 length:213 start_codon:yes stop_codon:yes gene_type:complete